MPAVVYEGRSRRVEKTGQTGREDRANGEGGPGKLGESGVRADPSAAAEDSCGERRGYPRRTPRECTAGAVYRILMVGGNGKAKTGGDFFVSVYTANIQHVHKKVHNYLEVSNKKRIFAAKEQKTE